MSFYKRIVDKENNLIQTNNLFYNKQNTNSLKAAKVISKYFRNIKSNMLNNINKKIIIIIVINYHIEAYKRGRKKQVTISIIVAALQE